MKEDLRSLMEERPFIPFVIHVGTKTYPIDDPENIKFTNGGNVHVIQSQGKQWLLNISQITVIDLWMEPGGAPETETEAPET